MLSLLLTAATAPPKKDGNDDGKSGARGTLIGLQMMLLVAAVMLAYTCNKRSGVHSPGWQAVLALFFPQVYLAQAAIRYAIGEYTCGMGN